MKKYLLTLPLVAILASCGTTKVETNPGAEKVRQKLPEGIVEVDKDDMRYNKLYDEAYIGLFNFNYKSFQFEVNLDASVAIKVDGVTQKVAVKGGITFGSKYDIASDCYYTALSVENFTVKVDTPEIKLDLENVNIDAYMVTNQKESNIYLDLSDPKIKSTVVNVLGINEQMWTYLFGENSKGHLNFTKFLTEIDQSHAEEEGYEPFDELLKRSPIEYLLTFLETNVSPYALYLPYFTESLQKMGLQIGVPEGEESPRQIALLLNTTFDKINSLIPGDVLKPLGKSNVGMMVTVGKDVGVDEFVLEALSAGVYIDKKIEGVGVKLDASVNAEACYEDEVMLVLPANFDDYNADYSTLAAFIMAYIDD